MNSSDQERKAIYSSAPVFSHPRLAGHQYAIPAWNINTVLALFIAMYSTLRERSVVRGVYDNAVPQQESSDAMVRVRDDARKL